MSEKEASLDEFLSVEEQTDREGDQYLPEIDSIPEDWQLITVDDISENLIGGGTPSKSNDEYWGGDIPWASVKDLNGIELSETEDYITESGVENSATNIAPTNSILISTRMTVGEPFLNKVDMAINQDMKAIIPDIEKTNPLFFVYSLWDKDPYLKSLGRGTTVDGITTKDLLLTHLGLPSLEEQRKIASVLYTVDQAIQKTEEIADQTKRIRRGYIRERVTAQRSDSERKEGTIGTRRVTIPEHWSVVRLGDVAEIVSGKSFPRDYQEGHAGPRAVIKVEDMNLPGNDKYINDVTNRVTDEVLEELSKNIFPEDTVIHPRVGEALLLNKTRITTEDAAFDDNIMGWVPDGINPEYLYYASTMIDFNAVAQTGTVPSINKEMASNFRFPLPPDDEQEEIVEDLSQIDGQISIYEQEKSQLQHLKQGLMQDLLSGELRTDDKDIEIVDNVLQYG